MNKRIVVTLALSSILLGCQTTSTSDTASSGSDYSAIATAAASAALQAWLGQSGGTASALSSLVQSQTNVSADQALGGVGSLLALAQNGLSSSQSSELGSLVPGLDSLQSSGLTSLITNQGAVDTAFESLGMDPSMAQTFTPIVLGSLEDQGASSPLVGALGNLWQ